MRPMRLSSHLMAVPTDAQQIPLLLPRLPTLVDDSEHYFFHGLTLDPVSSISLSAMPSLFRVSSGVIDLVCSRLGLIPSG